MGTRRVSKQSSNGEPKDADLHLVERYLDAILNSSTYQAASGKCVPHNLIDESMSSELEPEELIVVPEPLLIVGEPGCGRTCLLQNLTLVLARRSLDRIRQRGAHYFFFFSEPSVPQSWLASEWAEPVWSSIRADCRRRQA